MNTSSKRLGKVLSIFSSYLGVLCLVLLIGSLLMNRGDLPCSPSIQKAKSGSMVFTPNINLESTLNHNVKEVYVYLVHRTQRGDKISEKTVWDTLIKKNGISHLQKGIIVKTADTSRPLNKGEFHLRASYFPYVGLIRYKTFAVVKASS
ncbi:hypothetical protein NEHOM01_1938 [Nematocida homosporus]|uniref:uncharacterized protein n=1 Tax=Nematocida homosporus TaxID=1912981 RepID=UPI00221F57CE|nr:uncharacterized protein NEHOM01_1938 [Nematocida homosporus]KAI5187107.1 hypothetical protein NEHOM01_1938 [Nematocida homosporus]